MMRSIPFCAAALLLIGCGGEPASNNEAPSTDSTAKFQLGKDI